MKGLLSLLLLSLLLSFICNIFPGYSETARTTEDNTRQLINESTLITQYKQCFQRVKGVRLYANRTPFTLHIISVR